MRLNPRKFFDYGIENCGECRNLQNEILRCEHACEKLLTESRPVRKPLDFGGNPDDITSGLGLWDGLGYG